LSLPAYGSDKSEPAIISFKKNRHAFYRKSNEKTDVLQNIMAQQSEFIENINIDSLKIIKLSALYTALGATINSNIIYLVKLRLRWLLSKLRILH
jgi:NRPS condensation-like uncharacterized protein